LFAHGPADATAVPKPHHLLPQLNPDWFYLSGTVDNVNVNVNVEFKVTLHERVRYRDTLQY